MLIINGLSNVIFKVEKLLAGILLSTMFLSLFLGVVYRYYFNSPLFWSDEVAIFSLIWLSFIGGSMTIKTKRSAVVSVFVDNLGEKSKRVVISLSYFIVLFFTVYFFYITMKWIVSPSILVQRSSAMQLPMIIPYFSVVAGFFAMMIHSLALFVNSLRNDVT
ncbi:TRAP-type C4-dicarboxylate transport system permease small subunit [Evansella vedderi]|uniref:TRAP-type C4-dicarboxylate transport system permease small subunit n=1 Tax=Evansella vedderi TaxID=38282 RepID=A0ABT9ZSZ8_9BACI|nr:TRAP transporter small permease [Evansella vedderi]MDQ0253300.1 TRAP-type C4-dicarboxylate transport system permease small subunit [Evansella vedderi]